MKYGGDARLGIPIMQTCSIELTKTSQQDARYALQVVKHHFQVENAMLCQEVAHTDVPILFEQVDV